MNNNTNNAGCGFFSVLTIVFVVLKLVGTIDWSWWWVLSPILIEIGITVLVLVGVAIYKHHRQKKMTVRWSKMKSDMMSGKRDD